MFTGIIQAVGSIRAIEDRGGDKRLQVSTGTFDLDDVSLGDSIAVSGCCLTVVELDDDAFAADVSNETLSLTTLGDLPPGSLVNLEKSLRLADRLGGHLVSGHVDGIGRLVSISTDARSQRWTLEAPAPLARYIAAKGSISIDGVSLTVNRVERAQFTVNLIAHTLEHTNFHQYQRDDRVNLEVDLVARYLERLAEMPAEARAINP